MNIIHIFLSDPYKHLIKEDIIMITSHINRFFVIFSKNFRHTNVEAFETVIFLAVAHFFGCYNPKQLADYLGVGHQGFYAHLKELSLYTVKRLLLKFMVSLAAERMKAVLIKSDPTRSRACITISVDNSVIDRLGRMLPWTWSWYSGRWKKVLNGNDLLGIVITINGIAIPLHLLFCSKQGRGNTNKPDLLISMLKVLIEEFEDHDIDLTAFPITMDSWFISNPLNKRLHKLGFEKVLVAGKGNNTFTIGKKKQKASEWKKEIQLIADQWGIDVPFRRIKAYSPTFGCTVLYFYQKSTTRNYYLMDFSEKHMRGVEAWRIWKQHNIIEQFWKILKSVFKIKAMRPLGNGLYVALLIKVVAYLLAVILRNEKPYFKMSITQIMRRIRRDFDLENILREHFHLEILIN